MYKNKLIKARKKLIKQFKKRARDKLQTTNFLTALTSLKVRTNNLGSVQIFFDIINMLLINIRVNVPYVGKMLNVITNTAVNCFVKAKNLAVESLRRMCLWVEYEAFIKELCSLIRAIRKLSTAENKDLKGNYETSNKFKQFPHPFL